MSITVTGLSSNLRLTPSRPASAGPDLDPSEVWAPDGHVHQQAMALASQHRLFVQEAGQDTLRPAIPVDVLHSLGRGVGTLYVVTARGTTTARTTEQTQTTLGQASWGQNLRRVDTRCETATVRYSAAPVTDVPYFLSFPLTDTQGCPLPGVAADNLQAGGGTVEVGRHDKTDRWTMTSQHDWSSSGSRHAFTWQEVSDETVTNPR